MNVLDDLDWDTGLLPDDQPVRPPLPDYLANPNPQPGAYYGTLDYAPRSRAWVIKAEPGVMQLCRRLFPGGEGRAKKTVRVPAGRRAAGDINWLMLRYPLEILCPQRWRDSLEAARRLAVQQQLQRVEPLTISTDKAEFFGELLGFQAEGAGFLMRMERALLADEMGLGKTVQALAYLSQYGKWPALCVVPPHLCLNWEKEIRRFLRADTHIIKGLTPYALPEASVYIIHYLLLRGWRKVLRQCGFPVIVFDEAQELRHRGTEKYAAAASLADNAEAVIGLSGTPIYNRGGEIYNVLNVLDYHALGDAETFARAWLDPWKKTVLEPELLGQYLKQEGLMLRRTKEQVMRELPPKRRLVQEIGADSAVYAALLEAIRPKLAQLLHAEGGEKALLLEQVSAAERQATGVAKAPHVCAFVAALLQAGERVLLFAHHHRVMDAYHNGLRAYAPVFITGRETAARKEKSVAAFMEGKTRLCVLSLRAVTGLNLQEATCVVFGELDWSPAVHTQAEDRAHRIGSTQDSLLCYYLVSSEGSDRDMQELLGLKVSQFVQLMGDRVPSAEEVRAAQEAATKRVAELIDTVRGL